MSLTRISTKIGYSFRTLNFVKSRKLHYSIFASTQRNVTHCYVNGISNHRRLEHTPENLCSKIQVQKCFLCSDSNQNALTVSYSDIVKAQKDKDIIIIDVREQSEIDELGKLPGSIHIPMGNVEQTLSMLSDKDFKEKYGAEKPTKDTKVILSCQAGKRSGVVQERMQKLGYKNVFNYTGGWLDWKSHQKT